MIEDALALLIWMVCLAVGIIAIGGAVLFAAIVIATIKNSRRSRYTGNRQHPAYGNLRLVDKD